VLMFADLLEVLEVVSRAYQELLMGLQQVLEVHNPREV
jgi:hypothetical protein